MCTNLVRWISLHSIYAVTCNVVPSDAKWITHAIIPFAITQGAVAAPLNTIATINKTNKTVQIEPHRGIPEEENKTKAHAV